MRVLRVPLVDSLGHNGYLLLFLLHIAVGVHVHILLVLNIDVKRDFSEFGSRFRNRLCLLLELYLRQPVPIHSEVLVFLQENVRPEQWFPLSFYPATLIPVIHRILWFQIILKWKRYLGIGRVCTYRNDSGPRYHRLRSSTARRVLIPLGLREMLLLVRVPSI